MKTPVLSLPSDCRSTSLLREAASRYAATASRGVTMSGPPGTQASRVPSGQSGTGTIESTSGCSGASTMKVAPNSVSGRVVKTSIPTAFAPSAVFAPPAVAEPSATGAWKDTLAPDERPIQLRCISLTGSGQSRRSRSSTRRSEYSVIRIIHWDRLRLKTGKLPRSDRPSVAIRAWQLPGLQAQPVPVDDADHRILRSPG